MVSDRVEIRVSGTHQKDFRALHQGGAQRIHVASVAKLREDAVQIFGEQNKTLAAFRDEIPERRQCVGGQAFGILFLVRQALRFLGPLRVINGGGQMPERRQPEVGQVPDPVTFLVERHGLPLLGKAGVFRNGVQEPQSEGGLAHPPLPNEHNVLTRGVGFLPS